ncbi:TatD family hydrolase, partial [Candidatus Woesearchaeota archaeon]|nr:TatD family hydrolase [Candidatus Woesearchaeota archaeon]
VHAHLDYPEIMDDMDNVITRAEAANVKVIIANGIDPDSNRKALELSEKYDIVLPALGIYPLDALETEGRDSSFDLDAEIEFIRSKSPAAIGEIGLDLKHGSDLEMQKQVFNRLIEIAKEKDIPVIVHSRNAESHTIDILEESGHKKVILHCFSGKKSLIKRAADLGFSFSIPTNIVKSEHFQNLVQIVHISQLLTETDAPFLSPFPGKQNEPSFVIEATKKIAEIKGMTLEDTANNIFMNYQKLF